MDNILKEKKRPDVSGGRYTQSDSVGGSTDTDADADWDVLGGVRIGAIWRIQMSRPCAAAMQPYVKLL